MNLLAALDRLKYDHEVFRAKLDAVEAGLELGPNAEESVRELCAALVVWLEDHHDRECQLMLAHSDALDVGDFNHVAEDGHEDELDALRVVTRYLADVPSIVMEDIRPILTTAIVQFRHHLNDQEDQLFPALEWMADAHEPSPSIRPATSAGLSEDSTVNRVVRQHPETKPVFDRLAINISVEGCDCLDEVAWRHGLESRELLRELGHAVRRQPSAAR
ncbi:MAG: hemerythrin domain-containing protein [Candidatus Omnitrophica bacterium]|nr:hemerythrin domain-containing protein [Candidatus Omnitrophota bacterium]